MVNQEEAELDGERLSNAYFVLWYSLGQVKTNCVTTNGSPETSGRCSEIRDHGVGIRYCRSMAGARINNLVDPTAPQEHKASIERVASSLCPYCDTDEKRASHNGSDFISQYVHNQFKS